MSGSLQIREAIAATLNRVDGIGRVHLFERYAKNQGDLAALYAHDGQLRGWHIRRVRLSEGPYPAGEVTAWEIRGYLSLNDAAGTELDFDALIDDIRAEFRADQTLGGTVATTWVEDASGIQVLDSGPVLFAGVLCHKAVLALATQRFCSTNEE